MIGNLDKIVKPFRFLVAMLVLLFVMVRCGKPTSVQDPARKDHTLQEGVTETTLYITDSSNRNFRSHILRIDKNADAYIKASVKGYYEDDSTEASRKRKAENWSDADWGYLSVADQVEAYNKSEAEGEVVAAINGDFFDTETGMPLGCLVAEGNVITGSVNEPFFAVLKDGSCAIRPAGAPVDDVKEAVAGSLLLLDNGNIVAGEDTEREPRQAIGVCEDGTVVIVSIDGREPSSPGTTLYDAASLLKEQGCIYGLNLDGGGSTTFMTRRSGDKTAVLRSTLGDGYERRVSSALLVVSDSGSGAQSSEPDSDKLGALALNGRSADLGTDEEGRYHFTIDGVEQKGFVTVNGSTYYLDPDSKETEVKIEISGTKYTFVNGLLTGCSDRKAGKVNIGYCGSEEHEQDLIYAYHEGDKILNIGPNPFSDNPGGKMKNWESTNVGSIPWFSMRNDIKEVHFGEGVTSVGARMLYATSGILYDGTEAPGGELIKVELSDSIKKIGEYAFYNKTKLRNVRFPDHKVKIGKKAFKETKVKLPED